MYKRRARERERKKEEKVHTVKWDNRLACGETGRLMSIEFFRINSSTTFYNWRLNIHLESFFVQGKTQLMWEETPLAETRHYSSMPTLRAPCHWSATNSCGSTGQLRLQPTFSRRSSMLAHRWAHRGRWLCHWKLCQSIAQHEGNRSIQAKREETLFRTIDTRAFGITWWTRPSSKSSLAMVAGVSSCSISAVISRWRRSWNFTLMNSYRKGNMQWSRMSIVCLPFEGRSLWSSLYIGCQWFFDSPFRPYWNDYSWWCWSSLSSCSWHSWTSTRCRDALHHSVPKQFVRKDSSTQWVDLSIHNWNWNRSHEMSMNLRPLNGWRRHRNLNW